MCILVVAIVAAQVEFCKVIHSHLLLISLPCVECIPV